MPQDSPSFVLPFQGNLVGQRFASHGYLQQALSNDLAKFALKRNPSNPYDSNAIEIHAFVSKDVAIELDFETQGPFMLGHLGKNFSAVLAPEMDRRGLTLLRAEMLYPGEPVFQVMEFPLWTVIDSWGEEKTFELRAEAEAAFADLSASGKTAILKNPNQI